MADLARGFTFSDTDVNGEQTVTTTNLVALVASAGASQFGIAEFKNELNTNKSILSQVAAAAAGPTTTQSGGTSWYDSTTDIYRVQQGGRYDAQFDYLAVTSANAAATIPLGSLVRQTAAGAPNPKVDFSSSHADPDTLGISLADIGLSGDGMVRAHGMMEVFVSGAVTAGDLLVSSTQATGSVESIFNMAGYPTVTFGVAIGQCFKNLDGVASPTLVTCLVFL